MRHLVLFLCQTKASKSGAESRSGGHSLFELLVHGQDGGVAHEGEGQDGNGVDSLRGNGGVGGHLVRISTSLVETDSRPVAGSVCVT